MMSTTRMTTAAAIVRYLIAQRTVIDDVEVPLFPGVFAIFGHGNVTSLGLALQEAGDALPTWRGQNEQGMALAAVGYAKAANRRQIMVATSSIGPGALNMVTAAGVAHANRLPVLLLAGDTFASRLPDPVLQQVEHFGDPTVTVNDAFKSVSRYWDRIMRPEQIIHSLPHAVSVMLSAADCGPAVLALPQDVQAEAFDFPDEFFETTVHHIARQRADLDQLARAVAALKAAARPLIIAGGGVRYSGADAALAAFAEAHNVPVVETVAGRACLPATHPMNAGPVGVTGCISANELAGAADVILAVGTRLQDFTTGSWTAFARERATRSASTRRSSTRSSTARSPVVADAREGLRELDERLTGWSADEDWALRAKNATGDYHAYIDKIADPEAVGESGRPTYAQVIGAVDRNQQPGDYVLAAAGGFPGELINGWRAKEVGDFDCEYGFSCMGYEISGAWGAKMARPNDEVITFVGDGSYMMMNSDLYSSVLSGHKLIVIVCDNGGFAVINRLQINQGGEPFNNQIENTRHRDLVYVDFAAHAAAMGCNSERATSVHELESLSNGHGTATVRP